LLNVLASVQLVNTNGDKKFKKIQKTVKPVGTAVARQQFHNKQQWSNWETVFSV
jgi:hypothetical protein